MNTELKCFPFMKFNEIWDQDVFIQDPKILAKDKE